MQASYSDLILIVRALPCCTILDLYQEIFYLIAATLILIAEQMGACLGETA
jgi:hypothetical protein